MASWNAAVPANEWRSLGSANRPADETGVFEDAQAQAVKEVVAWQLAEAMKKKKISKNKMAALLKTCSTVDS